MEKHCSSKFEKYTKTPKAGASPRSEIVTARSNLAKRYGLIAGKSGVKIFLTPSPTVSKATSTRTTKSGTMTMNQYMAAQQRSTTSRTSTKKTYNRQNSEARAANNNSSSANNVHLSKKKTSSPSSKKTSKKSLTVTPQRGQIRKGTKAYNDYLSRRKSNAYNFNIVTSTYRETNTSQ